MINGVQAIAVPPVRGPDAECGRRRVHADITLATVNVQAGERDGAVLSDRPITAVTGLRSARAQSRGSNRCNMHSPCAATAPARISPGGSRPSGPSRCKPDAPLVQLAGYAASLRPKTHIPGQLAEQRVQPGYQVPERAAALVIVDTPSSVTNPVDCVHAMVRLNSATLANHTVEVALPSRTNGASPSPTRHAVVGFRFSGRLAQGPAVRLADRRHPLRLDVLTLTRSAYLQVKCAVVAQVERAVLTLHPLFRFWESNLTPISPTSSDLAFQSRPLFRSADRDARRVIRRGDVDGLETGMLVLTSPVSAPPCGGAATTGSPRTTLLPATADL